MMSSATGSSSTARGSRVSSTDRGPHGCLGDVQSRCSCKCAALSSNCQLPPRTPQNFWNMKSLPEICLLPEDILSSSTAVNYPGGAWSPNHWCPEVRPLVSCKERPSMRRRFGRSLVEPLGLGDSLDWLAVWSGARLLLHSFLAETGPGGQVL